ncbi:MAG TPA: ATP-grasp domain-containing protein [Fervidobacterium sp.]|nr:ATP-grasp domain-containing protein [Fervidobacterium sp.]
MKIAVVYDEFNIDEHRERMVDSVCGALSRYYEVQRLPFGEDFMSKVKMFEAVFNLSTAYNQIHVPAILDQIGIPYTGSGPLVHALCIDKSITKAILKSYGIPTPEYVVVPTSCDIPEIDFFPAIVKPVREGSARGIESDSVVSDSNGLRKAVRKIHDTFNEPALVERFIDGKELSVGILNEEVLPILEIDFSTLPDGIERFYSFRVKTLYGDQTNYICPARIESNVEREIKKFALRVSKILGLRNYARMDLRLQDDKPFFLEINSLPMLTPDYSDIVKMASAVGYTYEDLILEIMRGAVDTTNSPKTRTQN